MVVYGETRIATGDEAKGYEDRLEWLRPASGAAEPARRRQDLGERVMLVLRPEEFFSVRLEG